MAKVIYEQTLSRTIEIEVRDEQLAALRDHDFITADKERYEAHQAARKYVVETAYAPESLQDVPLEFVHAICVDENDEELFDL